MGAARQWLAARLPIGRIAQRAAPERLAADHRQVRSLDRDACRQATRPRRKTARRCQGQADFQPTHRISRPGHGGPVQRDGPRSRSHRRPDFSRGRKMKARRAPSKKLSIKAPLMARLDFFAEMVKANTFTRSALAVAFCLLYRHLNGSTCRCDPSIAVLAQETGLTTRSVKSAINELRERGWWRVSREGAKAVGGRTNAYAPLFEVVKHASPLSRESGEAQRHK